MRITRSEARSRHERRALRRAGSKPAPTVRRDTRTDGLNRIVTSRKQRKIVMRNKVSGAMPMVAITVIAGSAAILTSISPAPAQAPSSGTPAPALKTPWGEPDLQGIWTDETDTPVQRPPKYANQEFFTEAQRAEIDTARSEILGRERRAERGTERDVSGSYNNVFVSFKRAGTRTALIVDPPNGRMPPLTPEAQKI